MPPFSLNLSDAGPEHGHDLGVVHGIGSIEGRQSVVVAAEGIGPGLQQEADASRVALDRRYEEGSAPALVWQVDLGAFLQQEGHDLVVALLSCHGQGARASIGWQVDLSALPQQEGQDLEVDAMKRGL